MAQYIIRQIIAKKIKEELEVNVSSSEITLINGDNSEAEVYGVQKGTETILIYHYSIGGFKIKVIDW